MAKQGQPMKVPGKGHGVTGDPHAPKFPPVKGPARKSPQLPARRSGKK
jgi:hypothetical protein